MLADGHEELLAVVDRAVALRPAGAPEYDRDTIEQLIHGFEQLMLEALDDTGNDTRRLFLETAVPAVVAAGETPATIARGIATFASLLTAVTAPKMPRTSPSSSRMGL